MFDDKTMILVKQKDDFVDKTKEIENYEFNEKYCFIKYKDNDIEYKYKKDKVKFCELQNEIVIDDNTMLYIDGVLITDVYKVYEYSEFYKIENDRDDIEFYKKKRIHFSNNSFVQEHIKYRFEYLKKVSDKTCTIQTNKTNKTINLIKCEYEKIQKLDNKTILYNYLSNKPTIEIKNIGLVNIIYPFGLNASQKKAVENALNSNISIIEGPPGTGKTQTILNIIANLIINDKTVAIVSNNNSAIENILEKLSKNDLDCIAALLGNKNNIDDFIKKQSGNSNCKKYNLSNISEVKNDIVRLHREITQFLKFQTEVANLNQEIREYQIEREHFSQELLNTSNSNDTEILQKYSSAQILRILNKYEIIQEKNSKLNRLEEIFYFYKYGKDILNIFKQKKILPADIIMKFYEIKIDELLDLKKQKEEYLETNDFQEKIGKLTEKSLLVFRDKVHKIKSQNSFYDFNKEGLKNNSEKFTKSYPVVLSTIDSIKNSLDSDYIYDYLIIDEASQVSVEKGGLAFSCAKNVVIVGDLKQLPPIIKNDIKKEIKSYCNNDIGVMYNCATESILSSAVKVWTDAPRVLLREHYRCHPKIIEFCNKQFYNNQLIIMTEDNGEEAIKIYLTVKGNHASHNVNQREIDVINKEVIPSRIPKNIVDVGIISSYRNQVNMMKDQINDEDYEIDTIHKFQGREKDHIIISAVDNVIGDFVDDPNMLNVAISRAKKSLTVVMNGNENNVDRNYLQLQRYIKYNNVEIEESNIRSIFDLLYKQYRKERKSYLQKIKLKFRLPSKYDSENLLYGVIREILEEPEFNYLDCVYEYSLKRLVKIDDSLSNEQITYINQASHVDFMLYNKMDKSFVLAIEEDGHAFHNKYSKENQEQIKRDKIKNSIFQKVNKPLLRLSTKESGEKEIIKNELRKWM